MIRRILKGQRGFTLIELLVAVGILAILAGVAVPVVVKFTGTSRQKAQATEVATVQTAVDAMMADKGIGNLSSCTNLETNQNDMEKFPCTEYPLVPAVGEPYIRIKDNLTECTYDVALDGTVSPNTCP